MTAEGVFPKISGDILFPGDVNKLAKANEFIVIGSGFPVVGSATADQEIGSVVIPAGLLSNPTQLTISWNATATVDNTALTESLQISGNGFNGEVIVGEGISQFAGGDRSFYRGDVLIGSPFDGFVSLQVYRGGDNRSSNIFFAGNAITANADIDSKDVLVIFKTKTQGNFEIHSYSIQAFKGKVK